METNAMESRTTSLINFISSELIADSDGEPITQDEPLLTSGLLDSLSVMRLVMYLEETFDATVPPEHVTVGNFQTVNSIVDYLDTTTG